MSGGKHRARGFGRMLPELGISRLHTLCAARSFKVFRHHAALPAGFISRIVAAKVMGNSF